MSNVLNISMDQGSTLEYTFTLQNMDLTPFVLTGFDARLQVRKTYGGNAVISATLANTKLEILSAAGGTMKLVLQPSDTSGITFANRDDDSLECVYDLEIISPASKVYKPARGTFTLNREVTR